jgi:hypothetical protein
MSVHSDLVITAAAWLRTSQRCAIVITDMVSAAAETPDAIGFTSWHSILIECKASRADFRRDADKACRRRGGGMGCERFFMAPAGMLKPEEMPEGWGLLEVNAEGKVRRRKDPVSRLVEDRSETVLLLSAIRRIGQNPPPGISVKCYTLETERRATIGIEPETQSQDRP